MKTKPKQILLALSTLPILGLLLLLSRLPIYPDEEQWIYVNARQLTDHSMQYLFPVCREGFQLAQPLIWSPIRFFEWLLYSHLGLIHHIRVVGLLQAVITLLLLNKFLQLYARNFRHAQVTLFCGILIGLLPFLLVLNRPEQLLLILFLSLLVLIHVYKSSLRVSKKSLLLANMILLIISMPAIHPKGSLFAVMGSAIFIFVAKERIKLIKLGVLSTTCLSVFVSTQVWSLRTFCPESEFLTNTFGDITLNPTQMDASTFKKIAGNVLRTPKYLMNIMYQNSYQSDWMAQRNQVPMPFLILANIGLFLFAFFLLYLIYKATRDRAFPIRDLDDSTILVLTFVSGFIILAVLQRTKNFYDSYLPAVLILLASALVINLTGKPRKFIVMVLAPAIISIPALLFTSSNFPMMSGPTSNILAKQIIEQCEITQAQLDKGNFVIDGSLSGPFWNTPRFVYAGYIWGWWAQDVDAEKLIDDLNPPVIIVRDQNLLIEKEGDVITAGYLCRNSEKSRS
jgi:hypothetical protein